MDIYYNDNAIYKKLRDCNSEKFIWVSGNAWLLIYGNQYSIPKLLVFVTTKTFCNQGFYQKHKKIIALSKKLDIPFLNISFDDESEHINHVKIQDDLLREWRDISLQELKDIFKSFGVPVNNNSCYKAVNDKKSSAYHDWQRNNLGNITVSDIDLMRVNGNVIEEIIELKRSYYEFDKWLPFSNDYPNFNLTLNLCNKVEISKFTILYNIRKKYPFEDKPDPVMLFNYYNKNQYKKIGIFSFNDFYDGKY